MGQNVLYYMPQNMAEILVTIPRAQFDTLLELSHRLDNAQISEEEYVDALCQLGDLSSKPQAGDDVRIVMEPESRKIISLP